jgi:glycosyltransferase involved in cell wall biosynthesis
LIANVVHISLNARGGSERLAIATMQALLSSQHEISFDLTTAENPSLSQLQKSYGPNSIYAIKRVRKLNRLDLTSSTTFNGNYDLIINTHGDLLPYFPAQDVYHHYSKKNYITYCHFPLVPYFVETKDKIYSELLKKLSSFPNLNTNQSLLQQLVKSYYNMMNSSLVLTNSGYSRTVIQKLFGVDAAVVYPPVDVEIFRSKVLTPIRAKPLRDKRKDQILVISRFNPTKKIENALRVAKLLNQHGIGDRMKIVGNLTKEYLDYYNYLKEVVKIYDLMDYVNFEINVSFNKLISLMQESKVYFHTLPGEPFGISTVEAMSAGLVPIVPDFGGHIEFVPDKYQFHTFGEAVQAISDGLEAPFSERISLSNSVMKFSTSNYIAQFQGIVNHMISAGISKIPSKKLALGV